MKAATKYESMLGSFVIEINGDYVGVNNASTPVNRNMHYDMLANINSYIRAMEALGFESHRIYNATNLMLSGVDGVRPIEAW